MWFNVLGVNTTWEQFLKDILAVEFRHLQQRSYRSLICTYWYPDTSLWEWQGSPATRITCGTWWHHGSYDDANNVCCHVTCRHDNCGDHGDVISRCDDVIMSCHVGRRPDIAGALTTLRWIPQVSTARTVITRSDFSQILKIPTHPTSIWWLWHQKLYISGREK